MSFGVSFGVELDGGKPKQIAGALAVSFWAGSLGSESLGSVLVWSQSDGG